MQSFNQTNGGSNGRSSVNNMDPKVDANRSVVLQVVSQLPGAIALLSSDELRVLYMSNAARAYLPEDLKEEDVIGVRFANLVWDGENNRSVSAARRISESGEGKETRDLQIINRDGRKFWVDWVGVPVPNGTERWDVLLHLTDITDRKELEEALKEANERLEERVTQRTKELNEQTEAARRRVEEMETLMETVPVGIWVAHDPKCSSITSNKTADRLSEIGDKTENKSCEDWAGPRRFFRNGKEIKPRDLPLQAAVNRGVEIRDVEIETILPSGKRTVSLVNASPLFDDQGKVRGSIASSVDITGRRIMEEALRLSETKYRALFENLYEAVGLFGYVLDEQGEVVDNIFLDVNHAMEQSIGRTRDEVLGKSGKQIWGQEASKVYLPHIRKARQSGRAVMYDSYFAPLEKDYLSIIVPLNDKLFMSSSLDISDIKKEQRRAEESEEKFSKAFYGTVYAKAIARLSDGMIIDVNDQWLKLNGLTRNEALGHTAPSLNIWANPEDREEFIRALEKKGHIDDKEFKFHSKSGRIWVAQVSAQVLEIGGEKVLLSSLIDITERKKNEEALRRSNAELQRFAYIASHDLREPLRMISSYLDLLEKKYEGKLDGRGKEYIGFAVDGAVRMQELIDDILAYSKVETRGKEFAEVDMNEVLATVLIDLKRSIEETGASISHDHLPSVLGDRAQMILLLENIIGNSIKFRDVAAPQIHVSSESKGADWVFFIEDNGIGIPEEQRERIFQMFQRLHTKEEYEGTGIGLAIAKKIVERHGGRIWVESEEGVGSTFFFTIPNSRT